MTVVVRSVLLGVTAVVVMVLVTAGVWTALHNSQQQQDQTLTKALTGVGVGVGVGGSLCDYRQTLVHLFEWRWDDIADECEEVLAPAGYCAVQVSPPQEHRVAAGRSWTLRYEPVSYELDSHSGTLDQFKDMVERCNAVGVRVIVDAVLNNMVEENTWGYGSAGSPYDARNYTFPPYDDAYFFSSSCTSSNGLVNSYNTTSEARDCRLDGKLDLSTGREPVRLIMVYYLNELIAFGVAGFRVDAASNIWPQDLEDIKSKVTDLNVAAGFEPGTPPFFFYDLVEPGTAILHQDYYPLGAVTERRYGREVAAGMDDFTLLATLYDHLTPSSSAVVFVDSHLSQRDTSLVVGGSVLTYLEQRKYQMATAFMLADDYGVTARVMSSYEFYDPMEGPPVDPFTNDTTLHVTTDSQGQCDSPWVCEHRWPPIVGMVEFRNAAVNATRTSFEILTSGCLVLSRGDQGFFAMCPDGVMDEVVNTGLPEGQYCDVVSSCSITLDVAADGTARVIINNYDVPFVAYCPGCGPAGAFTTTDQPSPTTDFNTDFPATDFTSDFPATDFTSDFPATDFTSDFPATDFTSDFPATDFTSDFPATDFTSDFPATDFTSDFPATDFTSDFPTTDFTSDLPTTDSPYKRTVVFVHKKVYDSQYVFVRGGVNEEIHPECGPPAETDTCALPIYHQSLGTTPNYDKYDAWREGDDFLDWFGAESGQGYYQGIPASGTPMAWTTNTQGVDGYQQLNVYGDDYWMLDFYMDCELPDDEWFELKGWLEFADGYTGWELDISQGTCGGSVGGTAPSVSTNHKARCGYINVFEWNEGNCIVEDFPDSTTMVPPNTSPGSGGGSTGGMDIQRTIIFIEQHTVVGQDVFILGGSEDYTVCMEGNDAESDPCSLPIITRSLGTTEHYTGYDDWRTGDNYLDWHGAEVGQGYHNGLPPFGSAVAWTSNDPNSPGYQPLNTFGEAYWMLDFDLDCSLTEDGWFIVKGWLSGNAGQFSGLEDDVSQTPCTGTAGGVAPIPSTSHVARCGHVNVFHYDQDHCTINVFP